ncbi:D-alanine--D-alanine ligase [Streptomyces gamaensis]|uniref:D-alanine--D-alanine ligase n=1 Tax=Streptomyces gamaensis TaxID=1763542 RepID=A0ABW0YVK8_9ACTN
MSDLKQVLVLAGGLSPERDVSLQSGRYVIDALQRAGVDAVLRDTDATLLPELADHPPSVAIPLLHGAAGEDGTVREVLQMARVPYVGARPSACRAAFDKPTAKDVFAAAGIRTPAFVTLPKQAFHDYGVAALTRRVIEHLGLPLVVKPRAGGSALGVTAVESADQLAAALVTAAGYHPDVLIEERVDGSELAIAVAEIDGEPVALPPVEIVTPGGSYDYTARYTSGLTDFRCPAPLDPGLLAEAGRTAVLAHRSLGLRHLSRTDAIATREGDLYVLETNVAPGMTATSTYPIALQAAGHHIAAFFKELALQVLRG